jgi:hypothetical protein
MQRLLAVALIFACAVVAQAQTHEQQTNQQPRAKSSLLQIGEKLITIPDPEGYEEAGSQFSAVKERFVAIEPPTNDFLLIHLPEAVCNSLRRGGALQLDHFTKVDILKTARDQAVFSSDIAVLGAEFRKNGPALLDPQGPLAKSVMANANKELSKAELRQIDVELSQTRLLGEVDIRPDVYTFMMYLVYKTDTAGVETSTPMLASLTFLKVKHRLLYVTAYQKFSSVAAVKIELRPRVEALKQFTAKWINQILAANPEGE